jgi:hypothetical protein
MIEDREMPPDGAGRRLTEGRHPLSRALRGARHKKKRGRTGSSKSRALGGRGKQERDFKDGQRDLAAAT